jgi:LmbE family N-acetylglucosaminyl deacetylase
MKRVLIVAAHPDDEILGCGGLISKYRALNVEFKVIFVGEGSTCRFDNPSELLAQQAIKQRSRFSERALESLGISDYEFHDLPCGRLDQVPILSINKIIERVIREFKPDTVFTHSASDVNNDHRIIFNSTLMATRPGAQNNVSRLFCYEVLSSSEWTFSNGFTPNYFEEITQHDLRLKWNALAYYESEIKSYPFPRSSEGVEALAKVRGMQAGVCYAEAFHLVREIR